jgi:hypothetical protein
MERAYLTSLSEIIASKHKTLTDLCSKDMPVLMPIMNLMPLNISSFYVFKLPPLIDEVL